MKNKNFFLILFSALFTGFFVISNVIAVKQVEILGLLVSASVFVYPLTFVVSNIVSEKYGMKEARKVIFSGFISMIVVVSLVSITYYLPSSNSEIESAYKLMFENNVVIVIASLLSYLISQIVNLTLYNGVSYKKYVKHYVSVLVALFIDALLFKSILLYFGLIEGEIFTYISNQLIIGLLIFLIATPFFYLFTIAPEKKEK